MRDDEHAHDHASHISGMDSLYYNAQSQDESINQRFEALYHYFTKSSLAQAYALLESELRSFCNHLQSSLGYKIGLEHLKQKDYLQSMSNYLELVADLEMAALKQYFSQIQFLRNKIMHNGGEFPSGKLPS